MSALAVGGDTVGDEKESDAKLIEKDDEDSPAMRSILSRFAKTPKKSPSSAKGVEYTVSFEPGPIGLKLEPVLRNGTKEFGCRVMNFVDNGKTSLSPSQALKSGNIYVGDVLTAVNGKNVTSKSYKDIVSMLTATSGKRNITFRVPRSPATVMPKTPARSVTTAKKEQMNASAVASSVTTRAQNKADPAAAGSTPFFSPSSVKKMARSSIVKDQSVLYSPRKASRSLSEVLNTVLKNIAPDINGAKPTHVASVLSKQIGQILAGASSQEVDETVHMKLELLNELSQAKACLGEENMTMMTKIIDNIHKEKVAVQAEKNSIQDALSEAQNSKVRSTWFILHFAVRLHNRFLKRSFLYLTTTYNKRLDLNQGYSRRMNSSRVSKRRRKTS